MRRTERGQASSCPAVPQAERGRSDQPCRVPPHGPRFRNRLIASIYQAERETPGTDEERVRRCSLSRPLLSPSGSGRIVCPRAGQPDSGTQQWSSISSLHRPRGHTWPEVICCLSRRGLRVFRARPFPSRQRNLRICSDFSLATSSVATVQLLPVLLPESAIPASIQTTELVLFAGSSRDGSDGTRTRDLRRDRPVMALPA